MSDSDELKSPMSKAVNLALSAEEQTKNSVANLINANFDFGYEVGSSDVMVIVREVLTNKLDDDKVAKDIIEEIEERL